MAHFNYALIEIPIRRFEIEIILSNICVAHSLVTGSGAMVDLGTISNSRITAKPEK
jgi:hypothetical protein